MISFREIIGQNQISDIPIKIQQNIDELLVRVNIIREAWGKPMIVTSGLRTMNQHLRIYSKSGIFPPHVPMGSQHLKGLAVDISDPELLITNWLKTDGALLLEKADLYCEEGNTNWVHFQCLPFGSYKKGGTRWFLP